MRLAEQPGERVDRRRTLAFTVDGRDAAARALAELSPTKTGPDGNLFPPLVELRRISFLVAVAVARVGSGVDLWRWIGVSSDSPLFFHTRNITSANACHARGLDPLVEHPRDLPFPPGRRVDVEAGGHPHTVVGHP